MKLSEMRKDMKIKHSVSSVPPPLQCIGELFFVKKLCMGEQTLLGKFMGRCFTLELIIRPWKGRSQWLRAFKG